MQSSARGAGQHSGLRVDIIARPVPVLRESDLD
jgi:hypothetical protein